VARRDLRLRRTGLTPILGVGAARGALGWNKASNRLLAQSTPLTDKGLLRMREIRAVWGVVGRLACCRRWSIVIPSPPAGGPEGRLWLPEAAPLASLRPADRGATMPAAVAGRPPSTTAGFIFELTPWPA
jgi:hypothetical protein